MIYIFLKIIVMKMDKKLVSKQPWEPSYLARKHDVSVAIVKKIIAVLRTVSRKRVEDGIRIYKEFA